MDAGRCRQERPTCARRHDLCEGSKRAGRTVKGECTCTRDNLMGVREPLVGLIFKEGRGCPGRRRYNCLVVDRRRKTHTPPLPSSSKSCGAEQIVQLCRLSRSGAANPRVHVYARSQNSLRCHHRQLKMERTQEAPTKIVSSTQEVCFGTNSRALTVTR